MQQTATNCMPHLLSYKKQQNQNQVSVCQDLNEKLQRDSPILSRIIRGDETSDLQVQTMKHSQSVLHGRIHHLHAWRRPDNLSLCEVHAAHFFQNEQKCSSWMNSTCANCELILQCKHSTMSMGRWAVKTTWQVVHCRLGSLPLQCFCSICFVYEGMPHQ
jgi:hypothetical protein